MLRKIKRLFVIKTPIEAYMIIYALALGAASLLIAAVYVLTVKTERS